MNKFEAILLISPEVSKSTLNDNLKNFEESISNNSGKIKDTEDWGLRDLSYVINNFKKAFYKYYHCVKGIGFRTTKLSCVYIILTPCTLCGRYVSVLRIIKLSNA